MGSNMAEAHPVGFRFPMQARERGATLIHVDPHFSRTSAMCQQYVNIRTGTDIAFLGGLIRYILENDKWFHEYVMAFTNATTITTDTTMLPYAKPLCDFAISDAMSRADAASPNRAFNSSSAPRAVASARVPS